MKEKAQGSGQRKEDRGRTNPPGQNPQQNDAVDHDLYHDEGRPNLAKDKKGGS